MVYRKDGTKFDIDHETTVELCLKSQETGEMMEDLIAAKYGTTVKTIWIM
jgi:hypothetical protein